MPVLSQPRQEAFCQEIAKGLAQDAAYTNAGYKPSRANASKLRQQPHVSQRISELLRERAAIHGQITADAIKSTGLTKAWVIETLTENVRRSMQAQAALNKDGEVIGEYQYQGNVANRALELLGKELGMFIDRKEVGLPGEFDDLDAGQRQSALAAINEAIASRAVPADAAGEPGPVEPVSTVH